MVPVTPGTALCRQAFRYLQPPVFPAQQLRDAVTPHGHHVTGVKLSFLPGIAVSHATGSGGKVNVRMPLLVAAPRVDDGETDRQKTITPSGFQYNVCRETAYLRQQPPVVVYQRPELSGDGKGDVLPFPVRHQRQQVLYPDFASLYAAVGAGAAFTAETDFFV